MAKKITKNVFGIIWWLSIIAVLVSVFVFVVLPPFQENRQQIFEQEMANHNQTLDLVKENFAYVLETDNIDVDIAGGNVNLVISGEACDLRVTLNKQLEVISLDTVDKTTDDIVGPVFLSIGLCILAIISIYLIYRCFRNISEAVEESRYRKKQGLDPEIEVLV